MRGFYRRGFVPMYPGTPALSLDHISSTCVCTILTTTSRSIYSPVNCCLSCSGWSGLTVDVDVIEYEWWRQYGECSWWIGLRHNDVTGVTTQQSSVDFAITSQSNSCQLWWDRYCYSFFTQKQTSMWCKAERGTSWTWYTWNTWMFVATTCISDVGLHRTTVENSLRPME